MKIDETKTAQLLYKLGNFAFVLVLLSLLFTLANESVNFADRGLLYAIGFLISFIAVGGFGAFLLKSLLQGFAWLVYNSQFNKPSAISKDDKPE